MKTKEMYVVNMEYVTVTQAAMHAILAGELTQFDVPYAPCRAGGTLWVKEAWRTHARNDGLSADKIAASMFDTHNAAIQYVADGSVRDALERLAGKAEFGRRRAALTMPRWASRMTLRVTEVTHIDKKHSIIKFEIMKGE